FVSNRFLGGNDARGPAEVVCEFGRRAVGAGLQRVADPLVQPGLAATAQPVPGDPPREGVGGPPPIGLVPDLGGQACSRRFLKKVDSCRVVEGGYCPHYGGVEALTDD